MRSMLTALNYPVYLASGLAMDGGLLIHLLANLTCAFAAEQPIVDSVARAFLRSATHLVVHPVAWHEAR